MPKRFMYLLIFALCMTLSVVFYEHIANIISPAINLIFSII